MWDRKTQLLTQMRKQERRERWLTIGCITFYVLAFFALLMATVF